MEKTCGSCKHYIGGGDWNLCCDLEHPEAPCGFLCYKYTEACEKYEPELSKSRDRNIGEMLRTLREIATGMEVSGLEKDSAVVKDAAILLGSLVREKLENYYKESGKRGDCNLDNCFMRIDTRRSECGSVTGDSSQQRGV